MYAFRDPDKPSETPPVRMPVVDVGGSQMDVISRLLKDRILLLGQQVGASAYPGSIENFYS